jgi:Ca2+-transporting ATPase
VLTRERYPRLAEVPFDAAYKFMATFHKMTDAMARRSSAATSRAPRPAAGARVVGRGRHGRCGPVDQVRAKYLEENERLGRQGLRVMATARRDLDPSHLRPAAADLLPLGRDLTLLALVGIVDPPRAEAKAAIAIAHSAGIQVRMITGDHAVTAEAIARQLGITGRAITGAEFAAMTTRARPRRSTTSGSSPGSRPRTRSTSWTSSRARATWWP